MVMKELIAVLLVLMPAVAAAQQLRQPVSPVAPTSYDQCTALTDQWSAYTWRLSDIYQACLSRNFHRYGSQGLGLCKAEGRAHTEALNASEAARKACYADVKAYLDRQDAERRQQAEQERAAKEAEQERQNRLKQMQQEQERMQNAWAEQQRQRVEATRHAVEEQQRAAAEAERQRREESRRAVNDAMRELTTARDRAQAYKDQANSVADRRVDLTAGEMRALDDMRRRADTDGLRPRYVPAEPSVRPVVDGSALTREVAGLLGGEAESIVRWGLNRTEVGEYMLQAWDMADDFAGKYQALVSTYQYARSAGAGTTTYEQDVDAVVGGTGALAGVALAPTPGIAIQVSRVVGGVAGLHKAGLYQIQMLVASDEPLSRADIAKLSDPRLPIQALFGPSLPLERMHRMEGIWIEGNKIIDNGGFVAVFGR